MAQPTSVELEQLRDEAVRKAVELLAPSVVRIDTAAGIEGSSNQAIGPTTGVVVGSDGWILSNASSFSHRPAGILVTLPPSAGAEPVRLPAKVVATDHSRQLILLKIEANDLIVPRAAPLESVRQGEWAIALGRAWNVASLSVSVGIVSALGRIDGKAIQTDAKVSPMNYGGPLIDLQGNVLGVIAPLSPTDGKGNEGAELYDSGIGFAIPFAEILATLPRLRRGDLFPGQLGIHPTNGDTFGGPVVVGKLRWRSPAALAGIAKGDIVTHAGRMPVRRLADFREAVGRKYAGDKIGLTVTRAGVSRDFELTLVESLPVYQRPWLGIIAQGTERPVGLRVVRTLEGGPAAEAKVLPEDVIIGLASKPIRSAMELERALDEMPIGEVVSLDVRRKEESLAIPVTIAPFPKARPLGTPDPAGDVGKNPPPLQENQTARGKVSYRLQIPSGFDKNEPIGVFVYLVDSAGPPGETSMKRWRQLCDRNNLLFVAVAPPDGKGWSRESTERIDEVLGELGGKYAIRDRLAVLCGVGKSILAANQYLGARGGRIRGVVYEGGPFAAETEPMEPDAKRSYYLVARGFSALVDPLDARLKRLRALNYPAAGHAEGADPLKESEFYERLEGWLELLEVL